VTFGRFNVDYEQRTYNPERMRQYRLDRAHAMLRKYGLGSMVVYDFDNFRYLGYNNWHNYERRRPGRYILLIRDAGYPYVPASPPGSGEYELQPWLKGKFKLKTTPAVFPYMWLDEPYTESQWEQQATEIKALLEEHGVANEPCGIDVGFGVRTIDHLRKAGINVVDGNPAMAEARMIKNEDEIECCRIAGTIAEAAHWEVCKALKPGMTEWQVGGIAAKACYDLGAEELEGPSFILSSGPRFGNYGVQTGTDRVIRPGELFVIDINGVSFQGYRTCFYRTYCVGDKPTERQKDIYQACVEIFDTMQQSIKPGKTNHDYARAVLEKGGGKYVGNLTFEGKKWGPTWPEPGRYYTPGGHMLGLASGDPGPTIGIRQQHMDYPPFTFEPGMVIAVEVGIRDWDGSKWLYDGVKLENTGVVTETGWESFYRFPYKDLIAVGLPGSY